MSLQYIKRKRNPILTAGIVAGAVILFHLIISLFTGKVNLLYSILAGAVFFVLYFIFQSIQNIRISMQKK